ncbi:uncharacterized protein LOC132280183 isoform X2 [Cornus florida]|uniref:uncharacterized protein LOC132280183 isoform X2 n=1 Tax=Cornus florida TaxID=4283 RepID=UPI00289DFCFA|nr:uncharacterized protein LOC132280183 isoform X2 [Cornus florida]
MASCFVILILERLLRRSEFRADTVIGARMSEVGYAHLKEEIGRDVMETLTEIVWYDDKPLFLSFMKDLFQREVPKTEEVRKKESFDYQAKYCPPIILHHICQSGIIGCAIAFLRGETGFIADLNIPFNDGLYPLHLAANSLSYEMIATLLCHGARTDVRTIEGEFRGDLFPLNVSLETVSYHRSLIDWTPKQSIFKLIVVLCLPQMKVPLEINRLLAWNTKEVDKIFSHYAMEGELIEMATLLMVAREKLIPLSMSIRKSIIEEIVGLTEDEIKLIGSHKNDKLVEEIVRLTQDESKLLGINKIGKLVRSLNDIKAAMTRGILLLEVFEKAGVALEKYRRLIQSEMPKEKVANDINALLERAGFVINDKDVDLSDIDCESESIKEATEELESLTLRSYSKDLCMPPPSLSNSFSKEKSSVTYKTGRTFIEYGPLVFMPSSRSYVTFPLMDKKKTLTIPIGVRYSRTVRPPAMRVSAAYLLSRNQFASLALAIKKRLTCI